MKVVKVYGQLASYLGQRVFRADVSSPAEAVRFLCANFRGLEQWLIDSAKDGIGYRVMAGRTRIGEDDFAMPCSPDRVISITPVLTGAGGNTGSIFAGIGLIALSFLLPGAGIFGTTSIFGVSAAQGGAVLAGLGTSFSVVGASMVLGGVAGLISPTATNQTNFAASNPRASKSYSFSGTQNTSIQGTPIPVVYGKMHVGSVTISAGITNTDSL
jgi:predicted phage tail protein